MDGSPNQTDFDGNIFGPVPAFASVAPTSSMVSSVGPVSATGSATASSGPSAVTTSSSVVGSTAVPSWVAGLTTASIKTDMTAADVNGTVAYAGLEKVFADLATTLTAAKTALTAAEMADLKTIAANLNSGETASSYLTGITTALVNGNAANATWTGGGASSTTLGNLATGASATQLTELIGKWFLGTDLPSSTVAMSGESTFSISYSANAGPLFASSGPSMNDINQGYLGDCYLLSGLAEVAKQNASDITSMITSNGNGTYGVRFFENGQAQYVTVNSSLADGGSVFNSGTDIWASLVEKAYTQLQAGGVVTGNSVNYGNSYSTIGNGGQPFYALEEITGASQLSYFGSNGSSWADYTLNSSLQTTAYSGGMATSSLLTLLKTDLAKGDDVILSSTTNATDSSGKQTLVADHAMSIYGYDSATNMLEVRNPWGSESGQYWDTTFEVSLATLQAANDAISVDNIGTNTAPTTPSAPTLTSQTGTQTWKLGQAVSFTLPTNTFTDPQGQKLTYSATQANGAALPSWLTFNATTGAFTGTVPNTTAGLSLKVTATDTSGLSTSETFSVLTPATAPTLASQTGTQTWKLGQAVSFTLPSNTFTDPQGEKLTYTATQANGSALPSWLTFNAATGAFTGTVPNTAAGLSLKVTATDTSGLSVSETFSVLTPAAAPTLTTQTATQTWKLGQTVSFAVPTNTFTDPQGEKLTYAATQANGLALPSWLAFNATTGTFSGTVPNTAAGLSLKVTATDTSGLSVSDTFSVLTPATAPTLANQTAAQTWKLGQAVSFAVPTNTFTDPQGEKLTYTATQAGGTALPSWLTFNATTGTFSGTVPTTATGLSLKVTATDTSGLSVSETIGVSTVANAPTVASLTKAQGLTEGKAFSIALPTNTFVDPQGEKLTYSAKQTNGSALPTWLTFNAATDTFSGTAPTTASTLSLKVTATDTSGLSVAETFSAVVNTASLLAQAIASAPASAAVTSALTQLVSAPPTTLASSH